MSQTKSWDAIATDEGKRSSQSSKGSGTIRNLKMVSNRVYIIRFVGEPVHFTKYWVGGKSAVCGNPDTCPVRLKYGIDPASRYASNVFLRGVYELTNDEAEIKADGIGEIHKWEFPPAVTKPIISWKRARKQEPGGDNGCDWRIEVTGKEKNTRYNPTPLDITPFTAAEKEKIENEAYDLERLYKATPENEIEAKLFGDQKSGAPAPQRPAPTASNAAKSNFTSDAPPF